MPRFSCMDRSEREKQQLWSLNTVAMSYFHKRLHYSLTDGLKVECDELTAGVPEDLRHVVGGIHARSFRINPAQLELVVSTCTRLRERHDELYRYINQSFTCINTRTDMCEHHLTKTLKRLYYPLFCKFKFKLDWKDCRQSLGWLEKHFKSLKFEVVWRQYSLSEKNRCGCYGVAMQLLGCC